MKVFKEYFLDKKYNTPQTLYIPQGAEIVNIQDTNKGLVLLAIVDPISSITELRKFKICANDENIYVDTVKYIGSFDSLIGIKHVIEIDGGE